MAVLKRNSVFCEGGVDISNTVMVNRQNIAETQRSDDRPAAAEADTHDKNDLSAELELRIQLLRDREEQVQRQQMELTALKEQYIEQGKSVILDAQRRAEAILAEANTTAGQITADAEANRDDVFIKARAEGFEQGKKDGVEACLAAGQDVLDNAKALAESIVSEKGALFDKYEQDIYDTIMTIANKVTLDSLTAKDSVVVRKLIKKAAKEFRGADRIRITLDKNGATEELAADYEYLKELCGGVQYVEVELLPEAEPGTVIVEANGEITDAGIMTQLRMIQELGSGKFRTPMPKKGRGRKKQEAEEEEE